MNSGDVVNLKNVLTHDKHAAAQKLTQWTWLARIHIHLNQVNLHSSLHISFPPAKEKEKEKGTPIRLILYNGHNWKLMRETDMTAVLPFQYWTVS